MEDNKKELLDTFEKKIATQQETTSAILEQIMTKLGEI